MSQASLAEDSRWEKVRAYANSHAYMAGVERTVERVARTGEVFTPTDLIIELIVSQPLTGFGPGKTVLDPACGDGQLLVVAKAIKLVFFDMTEADALADIYGVDIMRDNVELAKKRLGGGTILMGNTLAPKIALEGQTDAEHEQMTALFYS